MRFGRHGRFAHLRRVLAATVLALMLTPLAPVTSAAGAATLDLHDRDQLAAFVDDFVTRSMAAAHVPGAVVALVDQGDVVYANGYGFADLARRTPVDPAGTMFRIASVSKIFTTVAVMQLAERGVVRLDTDVNQYLGGVRVPATYSRPVTLAALLTHTAGFEDQTMGDVTLDAAARPSLRTFVSTRMPRLVNPPGQLYGYSNYGFGLAGYAVEATTGMPFERYLEQQVFQPLGMDHTSFAQPLPAALAGTLATGYDAVAPSDRPAPYEYFADAPAEAMSTTALDMARFLIEQLGDRPGGDPVLADAARVEMQQRHFQAVPGDDLRGMAYGYERYQRHGVTILSKNGDVRGYASYLSLMPEQHFGFFIASNTNDNGWMQDLERQLIDRAFPAAPARPPVTPPNLRGSLGAFAGRYIPNRSSRSTIEKLRIMTQQIRVTDAGSGAITLTYSDGSSQRLTRTGPLLFASTADGVTYEWPFLAASGGRITGFLIGNDVYLRIPWYETYTVQLVLVVGFLLVFGAGLALWAAPALRRRLGGRRAAESYGRHRIMPLLAAAVCGLNVAFLLALGAILYSATGTQHLDYSWITYGRPTIIYLVLCLPLASLVVGAVVVALATITALRRSGAVVDYAQSALVILAELAFIPWLWFWNLLGFHF